MSSHFTLRSFIWLVVRVTDYRIVRAVFNDSLGSSVYPTVGRAGLWRLEYRSLPLAERWSSLCASLLFFLRLHRPTRAQAGVKDPNSEDDCDQTLEDAYFSNLRWMLENANRQNSTGDRPRCAVSHCLVMLKWRLQQLSSGVFQSAPYMPLQLVMNIKTPGPPCVFHFQSPLIHPVARSDGLLVHSKPWTLRCNLSSKQAG